MPLGPWEVDWEIKETPGMAESLLKHPTTCHSKLKRLKTKLASRMITSISWDLLGLERRGQVQTRARGSCKWP